MSQVKYAETAVNWDMLVSYDGRTIVNPAHIRYVRMDQRAVPGQPDPDKLQYRIMAYADGSDALAWALTRWFNSEAEAERELVSAARKLYQAGGTSS